jgi:hypothetical protein
MLGSEVKLSFVVFKHSVSDEKSAKLNNGK